MMSRIEHWTSVVLSAAGLAIPFWLLHRSGDAGFGAVVFLFTGQAFAERPLVTGGALDQGSLHKELFILCYSLVVLCPFLCLVRWLSRGLSRRLRSLLVTASLIALVHPLSVLTIFSWDVARYICHMGITPRRLVALAIAVMAYLAVAVFAGWLGGLRVKRPSQPGEAASEPARGADPSVSHG